MKKVFLYATLICIALFSCTKDELVPEDEKPEWLGESIYKELSNGESGGKLSGSFSYYLKLIDDCGLTDLFSRTGSITAFPANDEAFQRFFSSKNAFGVTSYEQMTVNQKQLLLKSSMLKNALLTTMFSNASSGDNGVTSGMSIKHETNASNIDYIYSLLNQAEMPAGSSYWSQYYKKGLNIVYDATVPMMVHLTREQMTNNDITVKGVDCDFGILRGEKVGYDVQYDDNTYSPYIFQDSIMKKDIVCQNGYIHQVRDVLVPPGNLGQVLRSEDNTTLFSRMLDYHSAPYYNNSVTLSYNSWAMQNNEALIDSIFEMRYISAKSQDGAALTTDPNGNSVSSNNRLAWDPGWNQYYSSSSSSNSLNDMGAILVPTDEALQSYFLNSGGAVFITNFCSLPNTVDNLKENLDELYKKGNGIITTIIKNHMKTSFVGSVPSKFSQLKDAGSGDEMGITISDIHVTSDNRWDVKLANNGVIYKVNKVFPPDEYRSVIGPTLTLPGYNIMNYLVSDRYTGSSVAKFGADMYYYLLAMKSKFAFFSFSDNNIQTYKHAYIDPTSLGNSPRAVEFVTYTEPVYNRDGTIGRSDRYYGLIKHDFNVKTGVISSTEEPDTVKFNKTLTNGVSSYKDVVSDFLNYQTIVFETTSDYETFVAKGTRKNRYYLTKNGGALRFDNLQVTSNASGGTKFSGQIRGGAQIQFPNTLPASEIDEVNTIEETEGNGVAFMLDCPVQPTIESINSVLNANKSDFSDFLELCDGVSTSGYLDWVDIPQATSTTASKQENYIIFSNISNKALDKNVKFLNGYNYTLFAPDNKAVQIAYSKGLPKILEIKAIYDEYYGAGGDEESKAKDKCANMIEQIRAFIRYHFMNKSVFADYYKAEAKYQSMYSNELGISANLYVGTSNDVLSVEDAAGNTVTVNASDEGSRIVNHMARDIEYNTDKASATSISKSSYAVIHQISTPLCYDSTGRFDQITCPASNRK